MAFPDSFLQELEERSDITEVVSSYVKLTKRSGANLFGLCPFHNEKTPSFSVAPDKQLYYCFGCGKGGGVINFIMEIENLSYPDAVRFLAKRAGLEVPEDASGQGGGRRRRMLELNRDAARFFHDCLKAPEGEAARQYAARRRISPAMITRFGLGAAPDTWDSLVQAMLQKGYTKAELLDAGLVRSSKKGGGVYDTFRNRLMFPVIDVRGGVIGFSGRILDGGEPKYLNSPETMVFNKSRNLFAMNLAKKSKRGYIILSEGNIDVVALHQAGFDCAVASLGTSLTAEQAKLISNYVREVVIAYDGDSAGRAASQRAIDILQRLDLKVRVLKITGAKDPDEYIVKYGPDAFENLIGRSENHVEYRLEELSSKYGLDTEEARVSFLREAMEYIASMPGAVEREVYGGKAAQMARVDPAPVLKEVERIRSRKAFSAKKREELQSFRVERAAQPKARELRYDNPRSSRAEEGVVRLLWLEPDLFDGQATALEESDFCSPLLGRLYTELMAIRAGGREPTPALLSEKFTGEEIAHFVRLVQKPQELKNGSRALADYINIIKTEKLASRAASPGGDSLLELSKRLRESKGYGGKKQ